MSTLEQINGLGQKIKYLRKKNHYTQEQVAESLGVLRSTYSHYETERIRPTVQTLQKLSRLYQVSMEELLNEECTPQKASELYDEDLITLLHLYGRLDGKRKEEFLRIVEREE